jgi:ribosomal protein L11 methyltransferase
MTHPLSVLYPLAITYDPPMTDDAIWTEMSLKVLPNALEPVAELLQEITGAGVTIEPPIEALGPDEGYVLDADAPYTLRAYLYGPQPASRRGNVRRRLRASGLAASVEGRLAWRTLREVDWANAWKDHYQVEHAGRIAVRPAWRDYKPKANEVVVSLDPGMAFGTGQHPTTRMSLLALQDVVKPGDHVLDLGAGSGVLAFAALALGAAEAVLVDTEEQAVAASAANAALNGMTDRVEVTPAGSIELALPQAPYDLVLANIIARVIIALAHEIVQVMKPGATLITSGIIAERESDTRATLEGFGLKFVCRLEEGDWRAFVHVKP